MRQRDWKTYQSTTYRVEVRGHLQGDWGDWFGGMTIINLLNGNTMLAGQVVDQAALHGLINKVFSLGLSLVAINQVAATSGEKEIYSKGELNGYN